jgi:hypothetical protein
VTPPPAAPTETAPLVPPTTHELAVSPKPKKRHRRQLAAKPRIQAPIAISRGSGGPARVGVIPVAFSTGGAAELEPAATKPSAARLFFLVMIACGFLLVVAAALPNYALRPAIMHDVVVVHRLDLALVGFAIVLLVAALYVLSG